jgi:branched-chain amino acid transport system substrate-binding protein
VRRSVTVLVATALLAACAAGAEGPTRRIAFVQDLTAADAEEHAQQALQAAELAVAVHGRGAELVWFDLAADPDAVAAIVSDPTFVGAIVGPGADGAALAEAGVPTVSVSTEGTGPERGPWRRLVAPITLVADRVADALEGTEPCVLADAPPPDALAGLLAERLDVEVRTVDPGTPGADGCEVVAWAGSPDGAVELASSIPASVGLVGGDRLLDPDFRDDVWPRGEGTLAVCACADVSTSIDPEVLRFVQDYQAEFGTAPGPYAVEAWDAARLLLELSADAGRGDVARALGEIERLDGLVQTYRFAASGERIGPPVVLLVLRAGRWVLPDA